jgi:hypothetical protein
MRRALQTSALALTSFLLLAGPALARGGDVDNGEGLVGETNDKIVTFFALGVVLFFAVFVIVMSALQGWLEKRKDARKAAHLRSRTGW